MHGVGGFLMAPYGGGRFALWLAVLFSIKVPFLPITHLLSGPHHLTETQKARVGGGQSTLLRGWGEGPLNYSLK